MKLLILKDSRITVKAGEIVEVSPAEAGFLMSTRSARPAPEGWDEKPTIRKPVARINPEFEKAFETPEATADAIIETVDKVPEIETAAPKKGKATRKK